MQQCKDFPAQRTWLSCDLLQAQLSRLRHVHASCAAVWTYDSADAAVFKLGSADQRGSATGSHGVRERIPKSVCTVFNNLRPICFQICTHKSVTVSVHCVEMLPWFGTTGFLLMSLSSAARDLLTTLMIGSSLLWEMILWLSVSVI